MLIEYPHDLAGVHCGAAADGDNAVGLERYHLCGAFLGAGEGRVGSDVKECGVDYAHFVELVGDRLSVAVVIQEAVCDDERTLLAHDVLKLVKSNGQAAFLIYTFSGVSNQSIFSPLGDRFDIDKVPTPTFSETLLPPHEPQPKVSDGELEVIKITDTAV